jgi:hypothetical protein
MGNFNLMPFYSDPIARLGIPEGGHGKWLGRKCHVCAQLVQQPLGID